MAVQLPKVLEQAPFLAAATWREGAPRNDPVASYASKISIASSPLFTAAFLRSRVDNNTHPSTDASGQNRGEKPWPPMGRNGGHQRGDSTAAYGEVFMATVIRCCR